MATVEEVKEFMSKAYLFGVAEASFEAAATATEKLGEWPGLPPYKSNLIRVGEEALDGKPLEPTRLGEFSILGYRPEWWKIQNPPTEFKATKQGGRHTLRSRTRPRLLVEVSRSEQDTQRSANRRLDCALPFRGLVLSRPTLVPVPQPSP